MTDGSQLVNIQFLFDDVAIKAGAISEKLGLRTPQMAKLLRKAGIDLPAIEIQECLIALATTPWGRTRANFVGGTPDPLDQYEWRADRAALEKAA